MCLVAFVTPLVVAATIEAQLDDRADSWILVVAGVVGTLSLIQAVRNFPAELKYYSMNEIEADSGIGLNVKMPGRSSGRLRLLLYYPLTFLTSSIGVGLLILLFRDF